MKLVSAVFSFRRCEVMPYRLGKSSFLFFYFAKNCDDEFYLHKYVLKEPFLKMSLLFLYASFKNHNFVVKNVLEYNDLDFWYK